MTERLTVVIPYFQREPGLLARALHSVFRQDADIEIRVIIVDDESPRSAESEIEHLDPAWRSAIRVIRQPNAGAGHARNTGLNAVPDGTAYVALLDPDDFWATDHLDRALTALRLGHDFFFCDICAEGDDSGHFARCGMNLADHDPIGTRPDLYAVRGDFFDRSLRHSPVPTSAVVMRWSTLGHLRFNEQLRPLGEDLLFWLDVARVTGKIAFSSRISLTYGEGVSGSWSRDWATAKSLTIINAYTEYYEQVRRQYHLTSEQSRLVRQRIRMFQEHFVFTLLGMLRRRRWPALAVVGRYVLRNPRLPVIAPLMVISGWRGRQP